MAASSATVNSTIFRWRGCNECPESGLRPQHLDRLANGSFGPVANVELVPLTDMLH